MRSRLIIGQGNTQSGAVYDELERIVPVRSKTRGAWCKTVAQKDHLERGVHDQLSQTGVETGYEAKKRIVAGDSILEQVGGWPGVAALLAGVSRGHNKESDWARITWRSYGCLRAEIAI